MASRCNCRCFKTLLLSLITFASKSAPRCKKAVNQTVQPQKFYVSHDLRVPTLIQRNMCLCVCVCLKCPADEEPLVPKTLPLGRGRLTGRAWLTVQLDLHCLAFKLQKLLSLQVRNVQVGTGFDAPNQMSTDIRPDTKDSCFPQGTSLHGLGQLPCLHGQLPRQVATGQLNKMQSAHLADPARTYIRARAARAARAATASVMLTPWIICQGTAPLSRARSVRSRRGG